MSDPWSSSTWDLEGDSELVTQVPAPVFLIWVQAGLAVVSLFALWTDSFPLRAAGWGVAVVAAISGVAYRFRYRQLSIRPKFKGLAAGKGARWLFRVAFGLTLVAIVVTSYRASLVIPE